jgi:hypothetical protein
MPQEEFLQRRRLAHQAPHAERAEIPQHGREFAALHLAVRAGAVDPRLVDARQPVQFDGRAVQLGRERRAGQVPQLREPAGLHGAAGADDAHPVAQRFDLGEDMAGEQDRAAATPLLLGDNPAEDLLHERVQTRGRLVEQQELDVRGQRRDEGDLLPVALGVGVALLPRVEVETLQQLRAAPRVEPAAQPSQQVDHLAAGQAGPQRDIAGHVGQPAVQRGGVRPGIAAQQPGDAPIGAQQAEEDPDRGGLSRAVGTEEAMHLARFDDQVEPVQSAGLAERLDQPGNRYRGLHGTPLSPPRGLRLSWTGCNEFYTEPFSFVLQQAGRALYSGAGSRTARRGRGRAAAPAAEAGCRTHRGQPHPGVRWQADAAWRGEERPAGVEAVHGPPSASLKAGELPGRCRLAAVSLW